MKEKTSRSQKYQYKIAEILFEDVNLSKLDNSHSLHDIHNPYIYDDILLDAQEQLLARIILISQTQLTQRQSQVFQLIFIDQKTTTDAAKQLHLGQSTIMSHISGNKYPDKSYGGLLKRLRSIIAKDTLCQNLLKTIQEHQIPTEG